MRKYPLNMIYIYFSKGCNLNCSHCWIDPDFTNVKEAAGPLKGDIELKYLKKALLEAKKLGLNAVKLTGGEPFIRKDIVEFLHWLKKNKLTILIETNGTLIGDKEAKAVGESGVKFISVSLDGPDAVTHDKLRGVKGSFEKAVNGIKLLRKHNPEMNLQVICTLWKGNKERIREVVDFCGKLGVNTIKINPVNCVSRGDKMKNMGGVLKAREILSIHRRMAKYMKIRQGNKVPKLFFDLPPAFQELEVLKNFRGICGIKSILGITGDGTVSICGIGGIVKELSMGNIKNVSLSEIWENNGILRLIREGIPDKLEGICGKCILKGYCLGKCRAEAYWANNSLFSPFIFCETAYKEGFFPKNKII